MEILLLAMWMKASDFFSDLFKEGEYDGVLEFPRAGA